MSHRALWTCWCSLIAFFGAVVGINATSTATAQLAGKLGVTLPELSQVTSLYLVAEIMMIPTLGWWLYHFSAVQLLRLASAGFVFASILCGSAGTLDGLLLGRVLQGAFAGLLMPLPNVLLKELLPLNESRRLSGVFSLLAAFAPLIGPLLSANVTASSVGWVFFACGGLVMFGLMGDTTLEGGRISTAPTRSSMASLCAFVVGLGLVVWSLEHGQLWGWWSSEMFRSAMIGGGLLMLASGYHQWNHPQSLLPFHLFMSPQLAILFGSAMVMGLITFGLMYILPYALIQIHHYDPYSLYTVVVYAALPQCLFIPLIVKLRERFPAAPLVMLGCILCAGSTWQMAGMGMDFAGDSLMLPQAIRAIGIPLIVLPIGYLLLVSSGPNQATAMMFGLCRTLGGAVGVAGMTAYVGIRQSSHWQSLHAYGSPDPSKVLEQSWLYAFNDAFGWLSLILMGMSGIYGCWAIKTWTRHRMRAGKEAMSA